jgi:hypothetical protein
MLLFFSVTRKEPKEFFPPGNFLKPVCPKPKFIEPEPAGCRRPDKFLTASSPGKIADGGDPERARSSATCSWARRCRFNIADAGTMIANDSHYDVT